MKLDEYICEVRAKSEEERRKILKKTLCVAMVTVVLLWIILSIIQY